MVIDETLQQESEDLDIVVLNELVGGAQKRFKVVRRCKNELQDAVSTCELVTAQNIHDFQTTYYPQTTSSH